MYVDQTYERGLCPWPEHMIEQINVSGVGPTNVLFVGTGNGVTADGKSARIIAFLDDIKIGRLHPALFRDDRNNPMCVSTKSSAKLPLRYIWASVPREGMLIKYSAYVGEDDRERPLYEVYLHVARTSDGKSLEALRIEADEYNVILGSLRLEREKNCDCYDPYQ